jgi:hypothetical protein
LWLYKNDTQTRKWHETPIFDQSKHTTEPLSDFFVQIELLIQAKNRLQNAHPLAFKNKQPFLFFELKHFWFEIFY